MKRLCNADALSGLMFVSFGVLGMTLSLQESLGSGPRMGPGFVPLLLSAGLSVLGGLVMIRGLVGQEETLRLGSLRPPLMIILSVVSFASCIRSLGLFPATFIAVCLACYAQPSPKKTEVVSLALGLSVFCSVVFVWALGLSIPMFAL
jgi:putative tricarboxylic transport membrane protein